MSYVEKNSEDKNEKKEEIKLQNPFKTMLSKDTIEESPEEIIAKDTDTERKELFKKTYDALLMMYPPEDTKKKKKKAKEEKEAIKQREEIQQNRDNREREQKSREDKGRER